MLYTPTDWNKECEKAIERLSQHINFYTEVLLTAQYYKTIYIMEEKNTSFKEWLSKNKNLQDNKKPIYKECPNGQCFCTGACKEIVGWVDNPVGKAGLGQTTFTVKLDDRFTNNI